MKLNAFLLLICAAMALKTATQGPPLPPMQVKELYSQRRYLAAQATNGQVICLTNRFGHYFCYTNEPPIPVSTLRSFGWTFSGITNSVVYNIYYSASLRKPIAWHYLGTVATLWFTIDPTNQQDWYTVQASNTATHYVSPL